MDRRTHGRLSLPRASAGAGDWWKATVSIINNKTLGLNYGSLEGEVPLIGGQRQEMNLLLNFFLLCISAASRILDQTSPALEARFQDCVRRSSNNSSLRGQRLRGERVVVF